MLISSTLIGQIHTWVIINPYWQIYVCWTVENLSNKNLWRLIQFFFKIGSWLMPQDFNSCVLFFYYNRCVFCRLLKDKSTFLSEPLIPGKNWWHEDVALTDITSASWSYLWFSDSLPLEKILENFLLTQKIRRQISRGVLGVILIFDCIFWSGSPENTFLFFKRQNRRNC